MGLITTTINDGGPAFPIPDPMALSPCNETEMQRFAAGMSLRDWFASKAMSGICAHVDTWGLGVSDIAQRAYLMADAMLRERGA